MSRSESLGWFTQLPFCALLAAVSLPLLQTELHAAPSTAKLVVWSEANLTGSSYTIESTPEADKEIAKTVRKSEIQREGLENKISSARLTCGDRAAKVSFSDNDSDFGNRIILECEAGESISINFHRAESWAGSSLGDKVAWYNLIVHTHDYSSADISKVVLISWDHIVGNRLPSSYSPKGKGVARWINSTSYEIKQYVSIDDDACYGQDVWISYKIRASAKKGPEGFTWGVIPVMEVESYDTYFEDEDCAYAYDSELKETLENNIDYFNSGLKWFSHGPKSTYYLSPSDNSGKFYAHWGTDFEGREEIEQPYEEEDDNY